MNLLLVVLGGGRCLLDGWLHGQLGDGFCWGTFAVNALGSLLIGPVFGLAQAKSISPGTTLFLAVGVLGGFTTFSAFSYETMRLLANGSIGASFLNVAGSSRSASPPSTWVSRPSVASWAPELRATLAPRRGSSSRRSRP